MQRKMSLKWGYQYYNLTLTRQEIVQSEGCLLIFLKATSSSVATIFSKLSEYDLRLQLKGAVDQVLSAWHSTRAQYMFEPNSKPWWQLTLTSVSNETSVVFKSALVMFSDEQLTPRNNYDEAHLWSSHIKGTAGGGNESRPLAIMSKTHRVNKLIDWNQAM
jgi:hypothetical protein